MAVCCVPKMGWNEQQIIVIVFLQQCLILDFFSTPDLLKSQSMTYQDLFPEELLQNNRGSLLPNALSLGV